MDCVRLLIDAGADKEAKTNVRAGRWLSEAYFLFLSVTLPVPCICLTKTFALALLVAAIHFIQSTF